MTRRHTAVALHYDSKLPAPLVVASGKGDLAQRLIHLAREHGIPVVESSDLAESLTATVPGDLIPERFYNAVAEILGFVWRTTLNEQSVTGEGVG